MAPRVVSTSVYQRIFDNWSVIIVRITGFGKKEAIADGLVFPTGLTIGPDGALLRHN